MRKFGRLPLALHLVACFFLLDGIGSAIGLAISVLNSTVQPDFGVLGILVFFGLMQRSNGWRMFAVVLTWINLFVTPIAAVLSFNAAHTNITIFGVEGPEVPAICIFIPCLVWFGLALWILSVLSRSDVVAIFNQRPPYTHSDW